MAMNSLAKYIRSIIAEELASKLGTKDTLVFLDSNDAVVDDIDKDVYDIIDQAYANIGGHPKINSVGDTRRYTNWAVADVDDDPEVDVAFLGKPESGGIKAGAFGTDGTPKASEKWRSSWQEISDKGWWSEVSGAPAHVLIKKLGSPFVDDEETARSILSGDEIEWYGAHPTEPEKWQGIEGWYGRNIGGHKHTKIIVGNFN